MQTANYSSENICRALGLGGFANDWPMAQAEYALRLLFKTSSSPEMCLTFIQKDGTVRVTLVAALSPVWEQEWDTPKTAPTIQSHGCISESSFTHLLDLLMLAECALETPSSITIHDGSAVHTVLRGGGYGLINIGDSRANHIAYSDFLCKSLELAMSCMNDVSARMAFRQFSGPFKQACRTVVLGTPEESAQIMNLLHELHARDKST